MNLSSKILLFLLAIVVLCAGGFIVYKQYEISSRQEAIEKQIVAQKELADNILRAMSQYTTREDLEKFAKDSNINIQAIKDDLEKLNGTLVAINHSSAHSIGQNKTDLPSTGVVPNTNPNPPSPDLDPYGYQTNTQFIWIDEQFENQLVPIGDIRFSAWKDKPWDVSVWPREYNSVTVLGTDENQRIYAYNKFNIKVGNIDKKSYDIKISNSVIQQVYPEAKWSLWNPHIFMTGGGAVNFSKLPMQASANAGVTLGIMSYGKFKTNPSLSVLQVGAGFQTQTEKLTAIINPINVNIGHVINTNLINNTYAGPSVQIDTGGNVFGGLNLSVGF